MRLSNTGKYVAIAAVFIAETVLITSMALGARDIPAERVFVGEDDVIIEVQDQRIYGAFSIARVVTPVDGWVIVQADQGYGIPAELLGAAPVNAGENLNVAVATDPSRVLPRGAFVSVLADRGAIGEFEYTTGDPDDTVSLGGGGGGMMGAEAEETPVMTESMDWPLVTGEGEPVREYFELTQFDVAYRLVDANIGGAFLDAGEDAAQILNVDAPEDSWVVIIRVGQGGDDKNEVIGSAQVRAGHTDSLSVPVDVADDGSELSALLVADLGAQGVLEVDPADPTRSVDAPYVVRSYFVWKRVTPAH